MDFFKIPDGGVTIRILEPAHTHVIPPMTKEEWDEYSKEIQVCPLCKAGVPLRKPKTTT